MFFKGLLSLALPLPVVTAGVLVAIGAAVIKSCQTDVDHQPDKQ